MTRNLRSLYHAVVTNTQPLIRVGAWELTGAGEYASPWAQVDALLSGYDTVGAGPPPMPPPNVSVYDRRQSPGGYALPTGYPPPPPPGYGYPPQNQPYYPMAPQGFGGNPLHPPANMQLYQQALTVAAAQKQADSGMLIREQTPRKARRQVLPMSSTSTIAANATETITSRPQTIAFRPQRIVIPSTIAPSFLILDIKVGNISQFVQSGAMPAEAFIPTLFDGEMEMDTCQTSQDFVMVVQNIGGGPLQFRATVFGRSAS